MSVKRWIYVADVWKKEHLQMVKMDITFFSMFYVLLIFYRSSYFGAYVWSRSNC
jgi:hypothetical protein